MKRVFWVIVVVLVGVFLLSFLSTLSLIYSRDDEWGIKDANIAVIEIQGPITEALPVLEQIKKYRETESLKALVVRLDTPGGAIGASQEIYMELRKLAEEERPFVMSMGNVAASGGLYISLAAPKVYALPGSLTGSMGVIVPLTNLSRLADRFHIEPVTIKSGNLKDAGNPLTPRDAGAEKFLQEMVNMAFAQFQSDVQKERELSEDHLKILSDGRVIDGNTALSMGIVHELGTFADAVADVASRLEIEKPKLAYLSRRPKSLLERVLSSAAQPIADSMERIAQDWSLQSSGGVVSLQ